MKNLTFVVLFILSLVPTYLLAADNDYPKTGMTPNDNMVHIGIVVKDINVTLAHWVEYLGLTEIPPITIAAGHEDNPTQYRGHSSVAKAKLAFLPLDNLRVELIEPFGEGDNHWKEFLKTKGEGVHHIAFRIKGLGEQYIENYTEKGYGLLQHGGWDGGEYGYVNSQNKLGVTVELIEMYK